MTDRDTPALAVTTRPGAAAEAGVPTATWARGADSLIGWGTALRAVFRGPDRIRAAADAWRLLAARASVDDAVRLSGSGLVGFGAFAFADESASESVLLVPRRIVGTRAGAVFTTVVTGGDELAPAAPRPASAGPAMAPAAYRAAVADAVARIRAGELEKVVLARDELLVPPAGFTVQAALDRLRDRYVDAWTFEVDGFFGASPETLVATDGTAVTARVLAGTIERAADPAADAAARDRLAASAKDRLEHAYAVDSLITVLGPRVADLQIGRRFPLALPNVWHLATDVTARPADGSSVLDLVAALHPTAAVAGSPRREALAVIRELEPFDRQRYAGPVGWVGADGTGEWAIGLRSAELRSDGTVHAFAGAGIVADSDPDGELTETGWKFAPVRESLGAEPGGAAQRGSGTSTSSAPAAGAVSAASSSARVPASR